jgi:hypothetical protein
MKTQIFLPQIFICAILALFGSGSAFAGGRGNHSSSAPGFTGRPAGRSNGGPAMFSASGRRWNTGGNFRGINYVNRNGVRWNSGSYRSGNGLQNGTARWNGNRNRQFAFNRNRNGNWNWNHHRRSNRFIFIDGFGYYPWSFPYYDPYYGSYYPYAYGGYPGAYGSDSDYGDGQPVYDGNNVDQNYGPGDDKGSYPDGSSNGSVAEVQRLLARAGFYKGRIDGAMGSRTYYAIRAYQRSHNLPVDGQIGPQLISSLGRS